MKITDLGIELDKAETEELMKTGYVLNEDSSICVVDQDGEYLVFERKQFTQLSIYDYLKNEN